MVKEISLVDVYSDNTSLIKEFLEGASESIKSFRYFENRPLSIVSNHIKTVIAIYDNQPVGYGHLDKELNNIWFGVAISDNFKGKGIGKKIMSYLINYADCSEIIELKLSVDTDNIIALKMYEKFGFVVEKKLETNVLIMKRNKNEA
jgi:RimJ/RimL family protein N-acetyltransferase